ncbi:MAG: EI24 domain-containing protein [Desulfobulbus sp.]|jgi:CysZ protein|uniref:EI24 domain-containing protein n=1 Tax=Desulfobulbus sp. TaxID=895 RepID=UPI002847D37E|nr:EI24 domain-containing protein [Desulfobulbus sp.]MDR2550925.1 EI24 domain-containing protein [Desulfobulbus sp.]
MHDTANGRPENGPHAPSWVPFSTSCAFLFRHPRLLGVSLLLVLLTGTFTWLGYLFTVDLINHFTGAFFTTPPTVEKFWHWPLLWGWTALKWGFLLLTRVAAFYLAFILAYSLTTPGYAFLSTWAGNRYCVQAGEGEAVFSLAGALVDLREGLKIGAMGLVVTAGALFANFVPVIGQVTVFVLYSYYSALMFVDYPASRYRWTLGQKLGWLRLHSGQAFRLGIFPALISMVPLLNIFLMALFFPLFTIHTTLNFLTIEGRKEIVPSS